MTYPQHHNLIRLPPPPPPHPHHSSSSGGSSSGSNTYSSGSSGGGSYNGGSGGSGSGGQSTAYPYKMQNVTAYSGLMFLAVGVLIARIFNFFKQYCTKLENSKRQGYLGISNAKPVNPNFPPYRDAPESALRNRKTKLPPSPKHPAIPNVPPKAINTETMQRLQTTGIRIMAHGVHCDPRKVWLSMDAQSINWQSEFQRDVPDINGNRTMVPVRGSLHRIPWGMIEYIDVGKRTDALKQATHVAGHLCFSLLTQEGSLDLQADSQLERDTLVSCIGMKLDELLGGEWRQLAVPTGTPKSAAGVNSSASGAFSDSSFNTMNQPFGDLSVDV